MVRVEGGFIAELLAILVLSDATGVADSATKWAIDFLGKAIKVALSFLDFLASGKALA